MGVAEKEGIITVSRIVKGKSSRGNEYFGMIDEKDRAFFIWDKKLIEEAKKSVEEGSKLLITYQDRKKPVVTKFEVIEKGREKEGARGEGINRRTALMQAVQAADYIIGVERVRLIADLTEAFLDFLETGSVRKIRRLAAIMQKEREEPIREVSP